MTVSGDPTALVAALRAEARSLGFDACGVTTADDAPEDRAAFLDRLAAGQLDGMPWLTVARAMIATAPRALLADAQSVIVVAVSYAQPEDPAPPPLHGRVARYARGRDYHHVLTKRLRALADRLSDLAGRPVAARWFVDAGPLAERAFARRAGVGWIGKNTMLLNRAIGTWTFLGALVTDLPLPPDAPLRTNCGACRRCLDACPTGALPAPYVLDAPRCISYLTIEHRGPIAPELRPLIGDWVFGCDICNEVCPVNRRALPTRTPDLLPRPASEADLLPLLTVDEPTFAARFAGSPIRRAKRAGMARNAAVALGNQRDTRAIPALSQALATDPDPVVRGHAAWALGQIGGPTARAALAAATDTDATVRAEIAAALAMIDRPD